MTGHDRNLPQNPQNSATESDVTEFLTQISKTASPKTATGNRRLLFAMDATASRQPMWDRAAKIQGDMFVAADSLGGLSVQLCFFRGFGEFMVSPWLNSSTRLARLMTSVNCRAGQTQIRKVLQHAANENQRNPLAALVYVGDCMEEDVDAVGQAAGELGVFGVPAFMFHEGADPVAGFAFKEIARLTRGAYCAFDSRSADQLRALLRAVAVYAAGGQAALEDLSGRSGGDIKKIAHQIRDR
jgi:hypothetical protein